MLGIAIPAHNEEDTIAVAVASAMRAAAHPALHGESCEVLVALDACTDATGTIARALGARTITLEARNVGAARALAAEALLSAGARWLAFTDADSHVSSEWLRDQLALDVDAVSGCVCVDDWSCHGEDAQRLRSHFNATYLDRDGHRHVHGANLGVSACAYLKAGGFKSLACSEDVDLVAALVASGARIAWSAKPRVVTSARRKARAIGGFSDALIRALAVPLQTSITTDQV